MSTLIESCPEEHLRPLLEDFPHDQSWIRPFLEKGNWRAWRKLGHPFPILWVAHNGFAVILGSPGKPHAISPFPALWDHALKAGAGIRVLTFREVGWIPYLRQQYGHRFWKQSRISFTDSKKVKNSGAFHLPQGFSLFRLTPQDFALHCKEIEPSLPEIWPDPQRFIDKGLGYAVWKGHNKQELAGTAYTGLGIQGRQCPILISVTIKEIYRGLGLSKAVTATLIEELSQLGLTSEWCAARGNDPSYRSALSLGFSQEVNHIWMVHTPFNSHLDYRPQLSERELSEVEPLLGHWNVNEKRISISSKFQRLYIKEPFNTSAELIPIEKGKYRLSNKPVDIVLNSSQCIWREETKSFHMLRESNL